MSINSIELLKEWKNILINIDDFNAQSIENNFKPFLEKNNLSIGQFLPIFRLVITGKASGPSMFDICEFLGKNECLQRIEKNQVQIENIFANFN